jgi:hypothetical protein
MKLFFIFLFYFFTDNIIDAQQVVYKSSISNVDSGLANTSVNTVIFRKNSLVTFKDTQFIAFYDVRSNVVLGKRKSGSLNWELKKTMFKGNTADAHNSISIMVDGDGYLHLAWDHHNVPLRYCKSIDPGSLQMTEKMPMTGLNEQKISYPEFYKMPDGNLLFLFRNGASGNGSLVINKYTIKTKTWQQLQGNLIDGGGKRNAYWQACVDVRGTIHISWVWRESADVASNHDMCYAASTDGGISWKKSTGEKYMLPITASSAEYVCKIPQQSDLINQTAINTDMLGNPYIATYYKDQADSIPQYHLIYKNKNGWQVQNLGFNKEVFTLTGMGTKRIPISRPQLIIEEKKNRKSISVIFRAAERGDKVSVAINRNVEKNNWQVKDLLDENVGSWEPTFDTELWKQKKILNVFIQKTEQVDGEGKAAIPSQMIKVLECYPFK